MGLDEAIVIVFSTPRTIVTILFPLVMGALYIYLHFSGKAKDKKYAEEMTGSLYTLRYYRKDIAQYIVFAILFISLSISLLIMVFIFVDEPSSLDYFISSLISIPGIVSAMIYIWKLKWKIVVSGDLFTVYRLFSKPKEIRISDIVSVGKKHYYSASRGYSGMTVRCYVIYVRSTKSSVEKAFEVHKLVNGFDVFENHLISTGITIQHVRSKNKTAKPMFLLLFVIAPISVSLICIIYVGGILALVFASLMVISSFYLVKMFLSNICISEEGVLRKLFFYSYIFIPWDSCVEIGIGGSEETAIYDCIYFSKVPLTNEQIHSMSAVKQNREHLWCLCDDLLLTEVLQYVDKDRIKNLDLYESLALE